MTTLDKLLFEYDPMEPLYHMCEDFISDLEIGYQTHGTFRCRGKGLKDRSGEFTGCPKCHSRLDDRFYIWRLEVGLAALIETWFNGTPDRTGQTDG